MPVIILWRLLLLLLAPGALAAAPPDNELAEARSRFKAAYAAALADRAEARTLGAGLESYPLHIYLRYYPLRRSLERLPVADVERFMTDYPSALLTERLRREWLRVLARNRKWELYHRFYVEQDDADLACLALRARIATGRTADLAEAARPLWLVGSSQSAACDPVFNYLHASGLLDEALVWERAWLAARAGRPTLARYVLRTFGRPADRGYGDLIVAVAERPRQTLGQAALRADTVHNREVIAYGVERLAGTSLTHALGLWDAARATHRFTAAEQGRVARALALAAVSASDPGRLPLLEQVPVEQADARLERAQLRAALAERAWATLARWTARPPAEGTNPLQWRYWHARSLEQLGHDEAAEMEYRALAGERDYYGFLASDKLGLPYSMNHHPVAPSTSERAAARANADLARAREWQLLGERGLSHQEWRYALGRMTPREIEVAAQLAHEWGWHDRVIAALGLAKSYDDLELRFPILHREDVVDFARRRGLSPALVYSIIRGESAFVTDARSPAGALGLMQLMPATGAETARQLGLRLDGKQDLMRVDTNVALGTEYLRRMINRFTGSFPLAAAAYNAGPGRVRAWAPRFGCVPADIWIDTIPFVETEGYVRRALFYAAIYEWRLGLEGDTLTSRLADVTPLDPRSATLC